MKPIKTFQRLFILGAVFLLAGCAAPTPEPPTPTPTLAPTATPLPPTATATGTFTPTPAPTDTLVPTETQTPTPAPTDTPTLTPTPVKIPFNDAIWVYYIERDTGGDVGCEDSAVAVSTNQPRTGDVAADVSTALRALLGFRSEFFGELYNPLIHSSLSLVDVRFEAGRGNITVDLSGTYVTSRDACDNGRVRAQVFRTIRQFKDIKGTDVRLNGDSFGDRVSNDK